MMMAIGCTLMFTSCKKDEAARPAGSGSLDAGKSSISFSTNTAYAGSTSFSLSNTVTTSAITLSSGILRNISLTASEISGTSTRIATMTFIVPGDASTSAGNLTGDYSLPNGATILPTLTLTSSNGAIQGTTYSSETGSCTITKLTATEIEGTFSAVVKDINGTGTISVSNGTFAGKF